VAPARVGDLSHRCEGGTDLELLAYAVEANIGDPDFVLREAIGWALRHHARTDSDWVRAFVDAHPNLSGLSRREDRQTPCDAR
jgi:3-methyladenine DNA glycosylase AlkD